MDNWCVNALGVNGEPRKVQEFITKLRGMDRTYDAHEPVLLELSFHSLMPVPDAILAQGHTVGYDWEIAYWGCAWGATDTVVTRNRPDLIEYRFDTPHTPPIGLLDTVSKEFPDLRFVLRWGEATEMFGGRGVWIEGSRLNQERYNLREIDLCKSCREPLLGQNCSICKIRL